MEVILKKELIANKTLTRIIGVSIFVILTALGAYVRIPLPFTPVPITLQTFFALLSGAFLGSSLGATSQAIYLLAGLAGLPLFSGANSGALYLLGPTAGYLAGFILASFSVGKIIKAIGGNFLSVFTSFLAADILLLACGTLWLKILLGASLNKALFLGFIPFIPGDLLKIAVASSLYLKLNGRLKEIF